MYKVKFQKQANGPEFQIAGNLSAKKANTKIHELEMKGHTAWKEYVGK